MEFMCPPPVANKNAIDEENLSLAYLLHSHLVGSEEIPKTNFRGERERKQSSASSAYGNLHFLRSFVWDFIRNARGARVRERRPCQGASFIFI
jgi:hypothetical protein